MLSTYLFILRRHTLRAVALTVLLASLVLAVLTLRPPTYESVAVLSVGVDSVAADVLGQNTYQEPERRVATELETLRSRPVADAATALLATQGRPTSLAQLGRDVRAQARGESNYLEVVGTAERSARAQELTDAVVTSYLQYRRGVGRQQLLQLETELQEQLAAGERELAGLPDEQARARAVAQERVNRAQQLLEAVRLRLSVDTTDVQLVAAASTPEAPVGRLTLPLAILVSLVAGGLLAMGLLLAIELVRDRVRTAAEAAHVTGLPVLAHLGRGCPGSRRRDAPDADAGAVRSLRLALTAAEGGTFPRRVMVVGSDTDTDAGATFDVTGRLAAGCASVGMTVLVLADRPSTTADELAEDAWVEDELDRVGIAQRRVTGTPELGAGWLDVVDPERELGHLSVEHDAVLLAAPGSAAVDPLALTSAFDRVLLVASLGETPARALRELVERLHSAGSEPLGVVVLEQSTRRRRKHLTSEPSSDTGRTDGPSSRRTAPASVL